MKTYRLLYDASRHDIAAAVAAGTAVCISPDAVEYTQGAIATFAGYPDGKHHILVKAAEARLAVEHGAELIIAVLTSAEENSVLTECVTLREAVPHPTTLAVVVDTQKLTAAAAVRLTELARRAGIDAICTGVTGCNDELNPQLAAILPLVGVAGSDLTVKLER